DHLPGNDVVPLRRRGNRGTANRYPFLRERNGAGAHAEDEFIFRLDRHFLGTGDVYFVGTDFDDLVGRVNLDALCPRGNLIVAGANQHVTVAGDHLDRRVACTDVDVMTLRELGGVCAEVHVDMMAVLDVGNVVAGAYVYGAAALVNGDGLV